MDIQNIPEIRTETVVFPINVGNSGAKVLLGKNNPNKVKCADMWNGPGGGKKPGESVVACAKRELLEETDLIACVIDFEKVGEILFHFGGVPKFWVHFFLLRKWRGEEKPLAEFVELKWFPFDNIPFQQMMPGDRIFVPRLLEGEKIEKGEIFFSIDGKETSASRLKWVY